MAGVHDIFGVTNFEVLRATSTCTCKMDVLHVHVVTCRYNVLYGSVNVKLKTVKRSVMDVCGNPCFCVHTDAPS